MKELSVEEKATRYDQAIKVAKSKIKNDNDHVLYEDDVIEIFPELAESEDERIRKGLIEACKQSLIVGGFHKDKVIAWLEKQGEQKLIDKIQLGKKYKCIASPRYSTFVKGLIYRPEDKFLCRLMNFCSDCFEPIEGNEQKPAEEYNITGIGSKNAQGKLGEMIKNLKPVNEVLEQKPADEIKPKFKHGDRVRNKKSGLEQTLGSCIEDVYDGAFPFRIKDQDDWELVEQKPADKVEPKFHEGEWITIKQ